MAITIESSPSTTLLHPAYQPIKYMVDSDNTAQANFLIYAYVYRDPTGDNELVATRRLPVRPTTTNVYLDIASVCQDYMNENITNLQADTTGIVQESTFEVFEVLFKEYYGSPATVKSTVSGLTNDIAVYNASPTRREQLDASLTTTSEKPNWKVLYDDTSSSNTANPFMTAFNNYHTSGTGLTVSGLNSKSNFLPIRSGQSVHLRWRGNVTTTTETYFLLLDEDFNVNHQDGIASAANTGLGVYSQNIGTDELDSTGGITFTFATDDKYMAVCMADGTSTARHSAWLLYEIDHDPCDKYQSYELHWLNRFGGYDTYVFDARSKIVQKAERVEYLKDPIVITQDTITDVQHATINGNHHTKVIDTYTVGSKILKSWMYNGFRDLFSSPFVFWNHPDFGMMQIKITSSDYEEFQSPADKAKQIKLQFSIDHKDRRQRI